jgi:hypothetical protein
LTKERLIELIELGFDFKAYSQTTDQYENEVNDAQMNEDEPLTETTVPVPPLSEDGVATGKMDVGAEEAGASAHNKSTAVEV